MNTDARPTRRSLTPSPPMSRSASPERPPSPAGKDPPRRSPPHRPSQVQERRGACFAGRFPRNLERGDAGDWGVAGLTRLGPRGVDLGLPRGGL